MIHGIRSDGKLIEINLTLPSDWRKYHADNVAKLDRAKVLAAVEFLGRWIAPVADILRLKAKADPEWWTEHHHLGMMACRNALRTNGFGEKEFNIDNLDDYAVGLMELALGVMVLPSTSHK